MHGTACLFLLLVWPPAGADEPAGKVIYSGRSFGRDPLPTLEKGHLLYVTGTGNLAVYGPDGMRVFDTIVLDPQGRVAHIGGPAIDTDGTVAVTAGYSAAQGYAGGIAFIDTSGKQSRFVPTGRYMPAHLTFDQNHFLWAFGWQRDAEDNGREDRRDYNLVRRFTKDGKENGVFLPLSSFRGRLNPFRADRGLWRVRAAQGRIGAYADPAHVGSEPEWLELDLEGNVIDRLKIGKWPNGGLAYTLDGRLFARFWEHDSKTPRLTEFDRNTGKWVPAEDMSARAGRDFRMGLLMGADGNDLVFSDGGGHRLMWARIAPK